MGTLRLKYIRKKMGFTQEELANYLQEVKHLKISRGTIAKYESGVNFPSKKTLKALSKALEVSEDFLAGKGLQTEDIEDALLNLLQKNFFLSYSNSNDSTHNAIKNYLGYLGKDNELFNFYKDNNGDLNTVMVNAKFPRYEAIDNFWKNNFKFLFEDKKFKETLIGSNKTELKEKVTKRINEQFNKDVKNRNMKALIDLIDETSHKIKKGILKENKGEISNKDLGEIIDHEIGRIAWFSKKIGVPVTTQEQIKELKALDNLLKKKEF
ncbi:helix-turn-helix domain-containing protein [Lactobacillus gasseri]|uniref:helix-turn-helix domain-containing protein n=1 Tax=Lactobacillus gasseri TaxID=1596 RepID=UPI00076418EA|nr:helix-turn-helix transcriptional regulator [Lactobacillus gasseri]KXA23362.1 DNA-binding helix-turn-helix protein [Lactobacillus gasseri]MCZ3851810.1 helix-turn-helix domain-containing protein [Lactobacillus gasseri]MCZ3853651.1 helix-turn-helix domain-containing protein [Lactobacillus gasseri]MCZ3862286.1 helix-turn-helix domain-containing protein [Lactobacillus gasseri]MCZ3894883.1 helix-turn-helix domain-containing protein [Lactobacillus gasseri]